MKKRILIAVTAGSLAVTGAAGATASHGDAATAQRKAVSSLDEHWLNASVQGDTYEVTIGKLAQQKGGSSDTKTLGSMLEKDHSKSLQETTRVAKSLGVKVESRPDPLQQQIIAILSGASGSQFDTLFSQLAVGDHELDIQDAQEESSKGQAATVKQLAKKELPTLQKHLEAATKAAKQAATSTGSAGASGSSGG